MFLAVPNDRKFLALARWSCPSSRAPDAVSVTSSAPRCGPPTVASPAERRPLQAAGVEVLAALGQHRLLSTTQVHAIRDLASAPGDDDRRQRELVGQLERLQDLYVMGDLPKHRYVMRRVATSSP